MAISTLPPLISYDIAWNAGPFQVSPPPLFTSISKRVLRPWSATPASRQYELDRNEAGTWKVGLDNRDGALDPNNPASPYATSATAPYVIPGRQCRVRATLAVNLLTADQATAGEGTAQRPGPVPPRMHVTADTGSTLTLATSAAAFQGTQIYQCSVPAGTASGSSVLAVGQLPVVPGSWYAFQAQAQVATALNFSVAPTVIWFDNLGNQVGTATAATATLTGAAGTWSMVAGSWLAPAGAYSATVKIASATVPAASTTLLLDGLQWEASATPTTWQLPGTLGANMLPREIATGTQCIDPTRDSVANWFYSENGTIAQASFLTPAPSGQAVALAWTSPIGTTSSFHVYIGGGMGASTAAGAGPIADCVQVAASTQYTASVYLMRLASADATVQVTVSWRWFDNLGNLLSTSSGTAVTVPTTGSGWIRGTCTATAPTGAVWGRPRIFISTPAATTAQNTIYATGWQLEQAGAASTWVDPGTIQSYFTGFTDQLPQRWELSGTWTRSDLLAVDALGGLGSDALRDPFLMECLALSPDFIYALNDPAGASMVADMAGQCPPGTVTSSPYGSGSLTFGAAPTGTVTFTGTQGPVAQFANTPSNAQQTGLTYISLPAQNTVPGYGSILPSQVPPFTRVIAFCATAPPSGSAMHVWSTMVSVLALSGNLAGIDIYLDTSGHLNVGVGSAGMDIVLYPTNYCDGNWHFVTVGMGVVGGVYSTTTSVDGVCDTFVGAQMPYAIATDAIGCFTRVGGEINGGLNASVALAAQFPAYLSAAQITNLYTSWRTASAGESTGARYARVLKWIGWTGPTSIDTGSTQDMGGAQDTSGSSGLNALASIALTENGDSYASKSGVITFKGRSDRYNRNTPTYIFGENAQWGEWPYEDVQLPLDQVHTYTDVQVSQYASYSQYSFYNPQQQVATSANPAAQAQYFDRVLPRTINVQSFAEVQDAATYLRGQYQQPLTRAKGIRLHPSAMPGLYAVCLALGKGSRIRVMRRPNAWAPRIQFDGFIERVQWDVAPSGDAWVTLECSPATRASYWVLSALRTTVNTQAAAGQNTAKINGLPDSAYNALASSLPQGYQLTFDPGTAIAETMTIAPGGIPTTQVGYFTATLTFTSNFAFTHNPGAIVCEPLPMGYTDPTRWDPYSVLGAGSAQLVSASGNQITIGPWPDGAANPLAANLTLGDLLWVGPGAATFEGYNLLHPNVATAGEGAIPLAAGASGLPLGMGSDLGTPSVTASGSAFQGANVWQVAVAAAAATPKGLIYLEKLPCTPGLAFDASMYVRSATTGANPQIHIYLAYLDAQGTLLGSSTGPTTTLTGSPTASWTRKSTTSTAPAGTVWAQVGLVLDSAPAGAWSFQADGLQYEQNSSASAFQVCPQVLSVGASAPGYSSVVVTLAQNLANTHVAGETVCDPLPPGTTSVSALSPTARLAY